MISSGLRALLCALGALITVQTDGPARPAPTLKLARERYRLRIENRPFGEAAASLDGGRSWLMLGRVLRPAASVANAAGAAAGAVLRASGDGIAFSPRAGALLKILPTVRGSAGASAGELHLNTAPGQGLFGTIRPEPGWTVLLQIGGGAAAPFPAGFAPTEADAFIFVALRPGDSPVDDAETERRVRQEAGAYLADALARARGAGRAVVSGRLTLQARLPEAGRARIFAVTYYLDGQMEAAQNTPPWIHVWDTYKMEDGEHAVEARAVDEGSREISRAAAYFVVRNGVAPVEPGRPAGAR